MYYKYDKYKAHFDVLYIKPSINMPNQHDLYIGNDIIGSYSSPEAAADAIALHNTGAEVWDRLTGPDNPMSLNEWEKVY